VRRYEEMRHLLINALAGSGLLLTALTASGQSYSSPQYQQYPSRAQAQDEREARANDRLFDQLHGDLDRAHAGTLPFTADRSRVAIALDRAEACQQAISAGQYDRRMFDDTVAAIQRVADLNRLSDQNRTNLLSDIDQVRTFQSRLEGY
jgi:hypothetical protein